MHKLTFLFDSHWQLRSLIGAENQNVVYHLSGEQNKLVQRLNTVTREAEAIKRLPFSPRCLVAENGWVCCGGETGEFTAIQVGEDGSARGDNDRGLSLDPDDRLPLDLDPSRPEDVVFFSLAQARSSKSMMAESKKFGKDLLNCITLWFPPTLARPYVGAYNEPMAVLSNNDKTVTLVKLESQEAVEKITYPDCVNRAIISPDGRLLVAITDDPYLYVHERIEKPHGSSCPYRIADRPVYEWSSSGRIHLRCQREDDPSTIRFQAPSPSISFGRGQV